MDVGLSSARTSGRDTSGRADIGCDLPQIIEQHRQWLDSAGAEGEQADFSGLELPLIDLTGVDLRNGDFNTASLEGAELLKADLRGASLLRANLQNADLLGAKLQGANLQGAKLEHARGLQIGQLAGANLYAAVLPDSIALSEHLKNLVRTATTLAWLTFSMFLLYALIFLRIFTTRDVQLLKNGPAIPFFNVRDLLPLIPFYLFGPVVVGGLYITYHVYLQRLWEETAALPAIFPDGRGLDTYLPWIVRWPACTHFQWLRDRRGPLATLDAAISKFLLYWVAPIALILFWGRYLTLQDFRGTTLHALLVIGAITAAMYFPRGATKAFETNLDLASSSQPIVLKTVVSQRPVAFLGIGIVLFVLSFGTIFGVPHDASARPIHGASDLRTWAADVFWFVGYIPTAQLSESDVSTKPALWTNQEAAVSLVRGAQMDGFRLRYIQASRVFLVKAHLWQADLRNANLSGADLRETNLRDASLRYAILDQANLSRAMLQEADLQSANLTLADLRQANLSRASLVESILTDSRLDAANLYGANLHGAQLQRANLQETDAREANLEGDDLTMAGLQGAYLSSAKMEGAQLRDANLAHAFVIDTDLRGANLSNANLQGAILTEADLRGANLQGSDLRGAGGLTAQQVCSAANIVHIQLDEGLQRQVADLCGANGQTATSPPIQ